MTKGNYRIQDTAFPETLENSCGYCEHASTYNEDRQCWCHKWDIEVREDAGICDSFEHF